MSGGIEGVLASSVDGAGGEIISRTEVMRAELEAKIASLAARVDTKASDELFKTERQLSATRARYFARRINSLRNRMVTLEVLAIILLLSVIFMAGRVYGLF